MAQVEHEWGISPYILSKWVQQFRREEQQAFPEKGMRTEQDEELGRLKRDVEVLKQGREILKNAVVIFYSSKRSIFSLFLTIAMCSRCKRSINR